METHKRIYSHQLLPVKKPEMLTQISMKAIKRNNNPQNYLHSNKIKFNSSHKHKKITKNSIKYEIQKMRHLVGKFSKEAQENLNQIDNSKRQNAPLISELKEKLKFSDNSQDFMTILVEKYKKKGYKIPILDVTTKNLFNKNPLLSKSKYDLEDYYQKEKELKTQNENINDLDCYNEKYWRYLNKVREECFDYVLSPSKTPFKNIRQHLSKNTAAKFRNKTFFYKNQKKYKNRLTLEIKHLLTDIQKIKDTIKNEKVEFSRSKKKTIQPMSFIYNFNLNYLSNNNSNSNLNESTKYENSKTSSNTNNCFSFDNNVLRRNQVSKTNKFLNLKKSSFLFKKENNSISNHIKYGNQKKNFSTNFKLITAIQKNQKKQEITQTEKFYNEISKNNSLVKNDIIEDVFKYIASREKSLAPIKRDEINKYVLSQMNYYKTLSIKHNLPDKHKKILTTLNLNDGKHKEIYERLKSADKNMEDIENFYTRKYITMNFNN